MAWQYPPYAILTAPAAIVSVVVAIYAARNRGTPGATPLSVLATAVAVWSLGNALQLASTTLAGKLFWTNLRYVGIVVVPTAWLAFALEYTGRDEWLTRRTLALLSVEPVAALLLVWTNPAHGLYWSSIALDTGGGFVLLYRTHAVGFWLHAAYSYLLVAAGTVYVLRAFLLAEHLYRSQAVALLVGAAVPWIGNALYLAEIGPSEVDLTPLAFVVTGVALTWAVFRNELLDLVPVTREIAREELVESMSDAVVVTDDRGRIVDLNPAAAIVLGCSTAEAVGRSLEAVSAELGAVVPPEGTDGWERAGITLDRGGSARYYDVRVSPIARGYGAISGYLVVLRDVTQRERQQQRLAVLNRVLRHDLRNEMNVLLAHADDLLDDDVDVDVEAKARRIREKGLEITSLADQARQLEQTVAEDEIVLERIDLVTVVENVVDALERDHPSVDVSTHLPEAAHVFANGLLDSAIRNLIENAIEHNDRGTPTVRISLERPDEEFVELRVADDGPGLPDRERTVLEQRVETPLRHSSGLGLWLVNWIVTESGGRISFADNEPRGTVVTIDLLAADGEEGLDVGDGSEGAADDGESPGVAE